MKKIIISILLVFSILIIGCAKEPLLGGDKDAHGCIGSAGYSWCEAKQKCLRIWEENCTNQNIEEINSFEKCVEAGNPVMESYPRQCSSEGRTFTEEIKHVCTQEESLANACTMDYNPVCGEIMLNMGKTVYQTFANGCSACSAMKVVSYTPGECPPEKTTFMCSDTKGNYMTLNEAMDIAKTSECGSNLIIGCTCPDGYRKDGDSCNPNCYYSTPSCLAPSIQCENNYFCNEGTGTFWINLNITKEGCSPACVINVETQQAEINWRCTGLVKN